MQTVEVRAIKLRTATLDRSAAEPDDMRQARPQLLTDPAVIPARK